MSPSVDGPTAIPSLPLSIQTLSHTLPATPPVASFLGGGQRMAQPEAGPQERQEPPAHFLRIPVPGSRPGSTGALPVALSPLRGRTAAELRNRGLRALPLASALAQGRHRGALFHLGYLPGIPSPPPGLQSSPSSGLAWSLLSPNRRRPRHRDLRATQKMPALPDPSVGDKGFHSASRGGAAVRTRASQPLCQLSVCRQTGPLGCRAPRQGLEPPSSSLSVVPEMVQVLPLPVTAMTCRQSA